ncbi:MAG TPA: hypothetical protein VGO17_13595 [Aurantimonas sp.]|jgi:hypothetical protein|nr:hypothetical protein [Aurantimonas sp.]
MMRSEEEQAEIADGAGRQSIRLFGRNIVLPANRPIRVGTGIGLVAGGIFGFLPILGFWMVPLGLLILSVDFAAVRRARRRTAVRWGRWRQRRSGEDVATGDGGCEMTRPGGPRRESE